MKSQNAIDLLCNIINSHYSKFESNGECISQFNPTQINNLEKDLYYSKSLLFEKLSTDIVIALKENLFYVLVKDRKIVHMLGPIKIDFKNLNDGSFISYNRVNAIAKLFYYLITGYELFYHVPRFVDESYKYYRGEKYFFSEEKIFNVEEQPKFTFNNKYQLFNVLSISIKEKNKEFLHNYINSLLQEDLFEELLEDYEKDVIEKLGKFRLQKNILIYSLSQIMFFLNEGAINKNKVKTYFIISEVEKAEDIEKLVKVAYSLIDKIINSLKDYKTTNNPYIRRATDFIICNLDQKLTLSLVSKELFISSKYLSFLFKKELNISFQDYIIDKKISKAKKLLKYTNKSISGISSELGIKNSNNFISFFKRYMNITPKRYRYE